MNSEANLQNFSQVNLELDPKKILFAPDNNGVIQYEEWKDVPEWKGYYQVSSFGRVKSLRRDVKRDNHYMRISEKIISMHLSNTGYFKVSMKKDIERSERQIHQIVAMAFFNHKPNGNVNVVDHIDNIKTNNFVWNLQIITNRHNSSKDKKGYTSKYVGVSWHTKRKKWRSAIYHNGKETHLGFFTNEKEAAEYYQNALKAIRNGTEIVIKRRTPVSEVKGITYRKDIGKWLVRVLVDGKRKSLGVCLTEEEAIGKLEKFKSEN